MRALLEELKEKNLINEELKDKLECYSDLPVHLLSRQGVEYTKAQRDFALTLHLHGPEAYHYLRETLHIHLPHPSSLQRWLSSLDAKPGLNKMLLDMLERRRQEDEAKYGCVTLMLDAMAIKKHITDRLFDILNSRNPRAKGFKAPLGSRNWTSNSEFLSRARRFLSILGFIINIDTLMLMVPVLLEGQRYVLTYRFTKDHLELLFNSIRASATSSAAQSYHIDTSTNLSAVDMSSAEEGEDLPSPFADIPALVHDHSYLPTRFDGLVDNALVYISGFVVRRTFKKLSCDVCRASLVTDAASASKDKSYHLLTLRNNGGLVIPSEGTVSVVRAAEWVIRQASADSRRSQPIKLLELRLHHIAKTTTLSLQSGSMRQKLTKTVLFKGH
ncbi:hypothetical protein F7725_022265 [Dissostichus mawsoni]|uniref:THAP domain containing 9 n=1 Tax=Dissostichus mawsoni TaxID=36200 RepID=A0A7J5YXL3_DISMA|nr:hypothetical protein F7725_022265 [Dissostichus mawsoni]